MNRFSQLARFLRIETPLGPDALLLTRLRGREGLSESYHFDLELLAEHPVAFDRLLGQAVGVTLQGSGCPARHIAGIISELSQGEEVAGPLGKSTFLHYQARLVPRFWLLTQRVRSRIWQRLSVPEILRRLLHDEWRLDVRFECSGRYLPRNYCVQYCESDFDFVSRLMEDEGIAYGFEHAPAGERLIVSDLWTSREDVPAPATLDYTTVAGEPTEPRVHAWKKTQKLRALKYLLQDHCFELPDQRILGESAPAEAVQVGKVAHDLLPGVQQSLGVHEYPCGLAPHHDGIDKDGTEAPDQLPHLFEDVKRSAQVRSQEQVVQSLAIEGASTAAHLQPGRQFTLARHRDADGAYLLTRVEHDAGLEGAYLTAPEEGALAYGNRFGCLPVGLPFRPPRLTAKPRILGTQTATVVGPAGEEVFCDKYGRVKVCFHWDRAESAPEDRSCWVRVTHPWAGKGFGSIQVPRVGQEVVVDFQDGDPDRPLVLGGVYNAELMPPYTLPTEASHSGFKSRYLGSQQDSSEIRFDDTQGSERLHLASDNDLYMLCGQNQFHSVGDTYAVNTGKRFSLKIGSSGDDSPSSATGSGSGGGTDWNWTTLGESFHGLQVEAPAKAEYIWGQSTELVGGLCTLIAGSYVQLNGLNLNYSTLWELDATLGRVTLLSYRTVEYDLYEHLHSSPEIDVLCTGAMSYAVYGAVEIAGFVSTTLSAPVMSLSATATMDLTTVLAKIAMLPSSLTLSMGTYTSAITAAGITHTVGANSIAITAAGITLTVGTTTLELLSSGIFLTTTGSVTIETPSGMELLA